MLAGTLTLWIEGEPKELGQGELARVGPEVRRQIANRGEENVLLLALGGAGEHVGRDGEAFEQLGAGTRRAAAGSPAARRRAMIEQIGEMPDALWRELVDGEKDPFEVGDSDIEWRGKTHHTCSASTAGPWRRSGWSWSRCRPAARPSSWRASAACSSPATTAARADCGRRSTPRWTAP